MTSDRKYLVFALLVAVGCRTSPSTAGAEQEAPKEAERSKPELQVKLLVEAAPAKRGEPVRLAGGSGFICAHRHEADLACFGMRMPPGSTGQAARVVRSVGNWGYELRPVAFSGVRNVEMYAGYLDFCLVDEEHRVRCSDNEAGYLVETRVPRATYVTPWDYWCGLVPEGQAVCFGSRPCFRAGEEVPYKKAFPLHPPHTHEVPGVEQLVQVESNNADVCLRDADGEVYCHGFRDPDSRCLVDGWERAEGIDRAVSVVVTEGGACALEEDGLVSCWGAGPYACVGVPIEGLERLHDPVALEQLSPVYRLRAHRNLVCALRENGEVWCWGDLYRDREKMVVPTKIDVGPAIDFVVGDDFMCVLLTDRTVECVGKRVDKWRAPPRPQGVPLPFEGKEAWVNAPAYVLADPPAEKE